MKSLSSDTESYVLIKVMEQLVWNFLYKHIYLFLFFVTLPSNLFYFSSWSALLMITLLLLGEFRLLSVNYRIQLQEFLTPAIQTHVWIKTVSINYAAINCTSGETLKAETPFLAYMFTVYCCLTFLRSLTQWATRVELTRSPFWHYSQSFSSLLCSMFLEAYLICGNCYLSLTIYLKCFNFFVVLISNSCNACARQTLLLLIKERKNEILPAAKTFIIF